MDEIIAGRNPVLEALRGQREINRIVIAKGAREGSIKEIYALAKERSIPVTEVERRYLDNVSPTPVHQGVLAWVAAKEYVEVEDILELARSRREDPLIVALDGLEDPHNLGTIIRTAEATGVHGIIIPKRRAVPVTGVVAKASAGAIEHVAVARVVNLVQTLKELKAAGCWVVGANVTASRLYYEANLTGPLVVVVGGEGRGVSRLVRETCDFLIKLPMLGQVNSLNAAVAASVVLYEVVRQRSVQQLHSK
ncbi:MAG: 23S rRNA (guanosine(2251)-2'-O)-methyltransferase RlmB [Firmicutes bacterium]|nr:23S rRNA (guanosine(2251)-2'-O)-methyltransferase RlmB [Bacillota bacterium]